MAPQFYDILSDPKLVRKMTQQLGEYLTYPESLKRIDKLRADANKRKQTTPLN